MGSDFSPKSLQEITLTWREGNFFGTGGKTRTYEGLRREIYSLLSLPLDDSGSGSIHLATNTYRQIVEPLYGFEP